MFRIPTFPRAALPRAVRFPLAILLLTLSALPLFADGAAIRGRVLSAAGNPAADASVRLVDLHRHQRVDGEARFHFEALEPGVYLVEALSRRYGSGLAQVQLAAGQEVEIDIRLDLASQVDEIVVSAGPEQRSRLELAQPISVLSGEELSLRAQPTLGETLAHEPGVNSTYFGPGASRPVIRGLGGDRVRMLVNGIGTNDASSTSADHAVSVDAGSAERIEVIRGPATLLYGASAIGGVVNVIDGKIPEYRPYRPLSGTVELRGGSVSDERGGSLAVDGGGGNWGWHADFARRETDDLEIPAGALLDEDGEELRSLDNSDLETESGSLGLSYFFGDRGHVGIALSGFDTQYGLPVPHHEEGEDEDDHEDGEEDEEEEIVRIDLEQRRVDLRGEMTGDLGPFGALKWRFGLGDYEHTELEGEEVGTIFRNDEWETRLELVERTSGTRSGSLGLQWRERDFEAIGDEAFVPPSQTSSWALFGFQEWELDALTFQLGARFENQDVETVGVSERGSRSFDALSASAGLVWRFSEGHSVAVAMARSTKAPSAEELYSNGLHVATQTFEIGRSDLGEETSLGVDVSLRREAGRFSGELTLFANRFNDFIYQAFTGEEREGAPVVLYSQADADFVGAELTSRFELWERDERHLDLQFTGDMVRAELRSSGESLPRIPPLRYGLGLHYHTDRIHTMVEWRRVTEQDRVAANETPTGGYSMVNASFSYRFFAGEKVYDVLLRGTNLTDEVARNHVSFLKEDVPLPGRDLSLSLRLRF